MVRNPPSPRIALSRWLAQLHYNAIRNIETVFATVFVSERRPLRGFALSDDLVLTRKRVFFRIVGPKAVPVSIEDVAANYNLDTMQAKYRDATSAWKNTQRHRVRT